MLCSLSAGSGIPSSLSFLLVAELGLSAECGLFFRTVFLVNAAIFADLALYLAQARLTPIPRLPIFVWS